MKPSRPLLGVCALALLLVGGILPAQAAMTVAEFKALCSSRNAADISDCDAYVTGVLDGLEAGHGWGASGAFGQVESQRKPAPEEAQVQQSVRQSLVDMNAAGRLAPFCTPEATNIDEVVDVLLAGLKNADQEMAASEGILLALRLAWGYPCAEAGPTK